MSDKHAAGKFCWNELATPNLKAAKEFYTKSFGWTFTDYEMDTCTYSMINSGNSEFAGAWEIPHDQQKDVPPHWMSYILVDNLAQSVEIVKKNGATIKVPATKIGDFGQFVLIIDPTGAHVALWESAEK
jgi:predicted enzyme related to lactoylglutathione lyase